MLIVRRWGSRQAGHGSLCGVSDQQHEEYSGDHRSDQTSLPMPEQRVDSDYGSSSDEELPVDVDRIANIVVARIENKLEQHLHLPMEMPSVEQAEALREKAPELYHLWLRIAGQKADTESYVERAPYQVPERLARGGRPWALGALDSDQKTPLHCRSADETDLYQMSLRIRRCRYEVSALINLRTVDRVRIKLSTGIVWLLRKGRIARVWPVHPIGATVCRGRSLLKGGRLRPLGPAGHLRPARPEFGPGRPGPGACRRCALEAAEKVVTDHGHLRCSAPFDHRPTSRIAGSWFRRLEVVARVASASP